MRRHNVLPIDVRVAQDVVGGTGFAPTAASHRDAGRRVRRKSFHQYLRPLVAAAVSQVKSGKFFLCSRIIQTCLVDSSRMALAPVIDEAAILKGLPYDESKLETSPVYKGRSKSLKINDVVELVTTVVRLAYNEVD